MDYMIYKICRFDSNNDKNNINNNSMAKKKTPFPILSNICKCIAIFF